MADVKIRKLDPRVVGFFKARARRAGHSLEEELRRTLADYARLSRRALIASINESREAMLRTFGLQPNSADEIRAEREERERRVVGH